MNSPDVTRVLVVDGHRVFGEGLAMLVAEAAGMEVVGIAASLAEAVVLARRLEPTVVVSEFALPDAPRGEVITAVLDVSPATELVILSASDDGWVFTEAVALGCKGFVTKDMPGDELIRAVRCAHDGEVFITQRMLVHLVPTLSRPPHWRLSEITDREATVLELMTDGLTNRMIAARLLLSVNTVRNHVQSLLQKLGAHSRLEAVVVAKRLGVIDGRSRHPSSGSTSAGHGQQGFRTARALTTAS